MKDPGAGWLSVPGDQRLSASIASRIAAASHAVSKIPSLVAVRRRASGPLPALAHTEPNRHVGKCWRSWVRSSGLDLLLTVSISHSCHQSSITLDV